MKIKFLKLLALAICAFMLLGSLTCISVFADESSESSEEDWETIWKEKKQPAYTTTSFKSVKDRIIGSGEIEPMQLLTVNSGYAFYGDVLTGEMVFLVLKDSTLTKDAILESGVIPEYTAFYCTNPYNAGAAKAIGAAGTSEASEKEKLLSQIMIKYSENDKDTQMGSFADAAANQQIIVKNIRGGVRVEYTIGREEVVYLVPRLIKKDKLEALRDQVDANSMSARDAKTLMAFYTLKDLDDPTHSNKSKKEMEEDYPITKQFPVYVCEPTISTQELLRLEKLVKSYTNYDYDTLEADHAETDYVASDDVPPLFKLALEYRVDGDQITIRCNAGNIRFDSSVYKLSDVLVLPYGGAGDVNNSGYMFSPDGSGALLDFSDLSSAFTNTSTLYGQDYAYHTITGQNSEVARLPVFGVYQRVEKDSQRQEEVPIYDENGEPALDSEGNVKTEVVTVDVPLEIAYLAIIEEGDSLAKINITYGGPVHNYASIYTSFNPRPKDSYVLDGGISAGTDAMWTVESKRKYTGDFQLRLFILDGTEDGDVAKEGFDADKSYSDMAAVYRNYLVKTGVFVPTEDVPEDIPLYIETLGAVASTTTVMGVPVETTVSLTSFSDTINIIDQLQSMGVKNLKIKMTGWYNGGLIHDVPTSIDIEKVLGDDEGFAELLAYANEHNVQLFPDIELSFAYSDDAFDGFDSDDDLSQTIDERSAMFQVYSAVFQGYQETREGIISPSFMKELYEGAYEDYSSLNVGSISVGSLGKFLSSDFDTEDPLTREDSKELIIQLLQKISENNKNGLLVTAGNEYTLRYATDILDVPLDDSRFMYSYATVPFMSMVLHSYKDYAGIALNLAGEYNYQLLKSIESGASPYFVVAANNTSELKQYANNPSIAKYYSVRYKIWEEDIVDAYKMLNDALRDVKNSVIRKHDILTTDGKVVTVIYENGIQFYVNYGENAYEVEGTDYIVPAGGFIKLNANGENVYEWEGE